MEELAKIANVASGSDPGQPIPMVTSPAQSSSKPAAATKPQTKLTNYSRVNIQPPMAGYGTTRASKSVTPPPVRT